MENKRADYSLLPYLNPHGNNFYLKISMSTEDPALLNKTPFPFLVMDDSGPLSRLLEGKLLSDAGAEVKRLFLLVQKDHYLIPERELFPLDNRGVEQIWQKAFSFYAGQKENVLTPLSHQIDQEGALHPYAPVFYCKTERVFFFTPLPPVRVSAGSVHG